MQKLDTPLALAQKLVSLPSYVSETQDETPATDFLVEYIQANLPGMTVERQYLEDGSPRCNLIVRGKTKETEPKLLMLAHIDTVQPKTGWKTNPLTPVIKQGKLYGLGAADMKGSLAAFLWVLIQEQKNIPVEEVMLLIYVDEEYDFKGMKRFVEDDAITKIAPVMTLSLDVIAGDLAVTTGCRGVIELNLSVQGKSGHASNPQNGINTATGTVAALREASQELSGFVDPELGAATTNIAYLRCAATQQDKEGNLIWLREGNIIPDTAEVVFEVRTPVAEVNAQSVLSLIERRLRERGLTLTASAVRHDIKPWPVVYDEHTLAILKAAYKSAKVPFKLSNHALQGYIDAQMVVEKLPVPTFIIGTGGDNKHGANENVPVVNITQAAEVYRALLKEMALV